jgi:phospholipid transport system substrate-binding protein
MRRTTAAIIYCIVLIGAPFGVQAADGPKDQTKETIDRVLTILKNKELNKSSMTKERRAMIRKEIGARFDFEEMSKRALGMHWKQRNEAEKKEFVSLFSDLLESTYINRIESYSGEKVVYEDQILDGDYATVKTRVITSRNVETPIAYRLSKNGSKWSVYDVVIEEVSLISNYRKQFNQVIKDKSYEALVKKLKDKQIGPRTTGGG